MHSPSAAPIQASKPVNGSVFFPVGSLALDDVLEAVLAAGAVDVVLGVVAVVLGVVTVDGELEAVDEELDGVVVPLWVWLLLW